MFSRIRNILLHFRVRKALKKFKGTVHSFDIDREYVHVLYTPYSSSHAFFQTYLLSELI